jgi:hypothetical protein
MRLIQFLAFIALSFLLLPANAQNLKGLPEFQVQDLGGNKIIISWNNQWGKNITTLNVQRSFDSAKAFTTIYAAQSPELPQNGYADSKAPNNKMYYRLFYVMQGGAYYFSKAIKPFKDTTVAVEGSTDDLSVGKNRSQEKEGSIGKIEVLRLRDSSASFVIPSINTSKPVIIYEEKLITIKLKDSIIATLNNRLLVKFRDSIAKSTKDTLMAFNSETILLKRFIPIEVYKPSIYIFGNKQGSISIVLPNYFQKKYSIKFFESKEALEPFMQILQIKDSPMFMDKFNFRKAGWIWYEIYEDGKLLEKHKVFIKKDV